MNKDTETILREAPLREVPASLDRAVETMIARDEEKRAAGVRRMPGWAVASACAACFALGFFVHVLLQADGTPAVSSPAVTYIEVLPGPLPGVLGGEKGGGGESFFERKRGDVKVIFRGPERGEQWNGA